MIAIIFLKLPVAALWRMDHRGQEWKQEGQGGGRWRRWWAEARLLSKLSPRLCGLAHGCPLFASLVGNGTMLGTHSIILGTRMLGFGVRYWLTLWPWLSNSPSLSLCFLKLCSEQG